MKYYIIVVMLLFTVGATQAIQYSSENSDIYAAPGSISITNLAAGNDTNYATGLYHEYTATPPFDSIDVIENYTWQPAWSTSSNFSLVSQAGSNITGSSSFCLAFYNYSSGGYLSIGCVSTNPNVKYQWNFSTIMINDFLSVGKPFSVKETVASLFWANRTFNESTLYWYNVGPTLTLNFSSINPTELSDDIFTGYVYYTPNITGSNVAGVSNAILNYSGTLIPMTTLTPLEKSGTDVFAFNKTYTLPAQISNAVQNVSFMAEVTFDNGTVRNYTSAITSLNVSTLTMTNCTTAGNQTINFTIYDESKPTTKVPSSFEILLNYSAESTKTYTKQFGYNGTGLSTYAFCLNSNSSLYLDGVMQYSNDTNGYSPRNYYIESLHTTVPYAINLYLLNQSDTLSKLSVIDPSTNYVSGVLLNIQRYYISEGTYITVAEAKTDSSGTAITYLRPNDVFYQVIASQDGTVSKVFSPQKFVTDSSGVIIDTYQLGTTISSDYFNYLSNGFAYSCTYTTATTILRCVTADLTGITRTTSLKVYQANLISGTNQICGSTASSASAVLTCNLTQSASTTANQTFNYVLSVTASSGTEITLLSDYINLNTLPAYGIDGLVFALFMFLLLVMIGSFNPVVSIVMGVVALLVTMALGFIAIPMSAIMSLIAVVAILVWKMQRS